MSGPQARITRPSDKRRDTATPKTTKFVDEIIDDADAEDDDGRTESQQIVAITKLLSEPTKKDDFLKRFEKKVQHDKTELKEMMRQREETFATDEASYRAAVKAHITAALAPHPSLKDRSDLTIKPDVDMNTSLEDMSPEKVVRDTLARSKAFLRAYERLSQKAENAVPKNDEEKTKDWQEDKEKVARLLKIGKKIAARDIHKVVHAEIRENAVGSTAGAESPEEASTAAKYFKEKNSDGEHTLVAAMTQTLKGVRRLTKALPNDV